MKKILIAGIVGCMVMGGVAFASTGSPVDTKCCEDMQSQIETLKAQQAQVVAGINNVSKRVYSLNDNNKAEDMFYVSGTVGFNFLTGTDLDDIFDDNGWQGSIALGNRVQEHIRLEAEYQYLNGDDGLDVNTIMGNVYYDFGTWAKFTPYATTGIGIGWFNADDFSTDDSMVWKLGAGVDYAINDTFSVGARYTYFDAIDDIDYDSNQIGVVATINF